MRSPGDHSSRRAIHIAPLSMQVNTRSGSVAATANAGALTSPAWGGDSDLEPTQDGIGVARDLDREHAELALRKPLGEPRAALPVAGELLANLVDDRARHLARRSRQLGLPTDL